MPRRWEEEHWRSVGGQSSYTDGPADCIPTVLICVFLQVISSLVLNGFSENVSWKVNSAAAPEGKHATLACGDLLG